MKDMKEDYLWDRSGEPDTELQKLEEILGTLKYQPRPLQIPDDLQIGGQRRYFQPFAIAAVIALFAVVMGLWIFFNRTTSAPPQTAEQKSPEVQKGVEKGPSKNAEDKTGNEEVASYRPEHKRKPRAANRNLVAGNRVPSIRKDTRQPELTPEELAEKQQLLTALRLVSAKLNVAQRRTQGSPQSNTIRNQRKIG
ncbi:MAG: hypothetical protein AABM67_18505 [Acidobacteriota bacterium]